jgi:long-chain-fatty-acid--CoA ligase ACSBG
LTNFLEPFLTAFPPNDIGVMLSHDNIYWTAMTASEVIKMRPFREVMVSYLPLSHVAANMVDIWSTMATNGSVFFADKMAMKGTLLTTLREARQDFLSFQSNLLYIGTYVL